MIPTIRKQSEVIEDLKALVKEKGYIYALCMILFEDNHIIVEELNDVNFHERLNKNEISLIVGFLIQDKIDFRYPESPQQLLQFKARTYELMNELHECLNNPMLSKIKDAIEKNLLDSNLPTIKDLQGNNTFVEPIFYANDGVYDFQFLHYLKLKYKYDEEWLKRNRDYEFDNIISIVNQIKKLSEKRISAVEFLSLKEKLPEIKDKYRKHFKGAKSLFERKFAEYAEILEFYQYKSLFPKIDEEDKIFPHKIYSEGWESFYNNIIDLFVVKKSDFDENLRFDSFINNFSVVPSSNTNKNFNNVGDFNVFTALPLIKLDDTRFFIPMSYSVY